jgi:hypothetical protein
MNEEELLASAFVVVHGRLNQLGYRSVAALMESWHPAILGVMLRAVHEAKLRRYSGFHPDYDGVLCGLKSRGAEKRRR